MNEPELQAYLIKWLSYDFELYTGRGGGGVWGVSMRDPRQDVRIDIVAKARKHVVKAGFTKQPFGIEVKEPDGGRKLFDMAFQCLDYRFSLFELRDGLTELAFILAYPGLLKYDANSGRFLSRFLARFQVGWVDVDEYGWSISALAGHAYMRKSNDQYYLTNQKNYPLVTPRYGNYKASKSRKTHGAAP